MIQVWFLFKILETIIGTACMIYHAIGMTDKEPLPHVMLFCGTFFGFTMLSITGLISIIVGNVPSTLIECILNFCASIMYFLSSIISMHYAEKDFHLMYLSDFEEPLHPFFDYCRSQSICALTAGALHLLHAILAFDALFETRFNSLFIEEVDSAESDVVISHDKRPLRMYFLSSYIEKKLRKFVWFDNLCDRKHPSISIYSSTRKYRQSEMGKASSQSKSDDNKTSKESDVDVIETVQSTRQLATDLSESITKILKSPRKKNITIKTTESEKELPKKMESRSTMDQSPKNYLKESSTSEYSDVQLQLERKKIEKPSSSKQNEEMQLSTTSKENEEMEKASYSQKFEKPVVFRFPGPESVVESKEVEENPTVRDPDLSSEQSSTYETAKEGDEDKNKEKPKP